MSIVEFPRYAIIFLLIRSYILLGASLFKAWENWDYLDGSYFCFISLSSIGFGDLVPGAAVSWRFSIIADEHFQFAFYDALQSLQQLIRRNKSSLSIKFVR